MAISVDKVSWAKLFKSIRCPRPSCAALLQPVYHEGGTSGQLDLRRWAGGQQGKYAGTPLLSVAILSKGLEIECLHHCFFFFYRCILSLYRFAVSNTPYHLFSTRCQLFFSPPPPTPNFLYLSYSTPIGERSLLRRCIHPFRLFERSLQPAHTSPLTPRTPGPPPHPHPAQPGPPPHPHPARHPTRPATAPTRLHSACSINCSV